MVSESEKEDIRNRLPLEDVIRDYNISLLRSGRGYKALCPFHAEKTPSFHVNVEGQYFHCFGCEERGDLFTFVQKIEHLDFPQTVDLLARRAGVELRDYRGSGGGRQRRRDNIPGLYEVLSFARDFYHWFLLREPAAHAARKYLIERGIELPAWETFGLGFSPPEGNALLTGATKKGFSPEILEEAGLARSRDREAASQFEPSGAAGGGGFYDYFRGRIMFPITGTQRRTVGFGARILTSGDRPEEPGKNGPKYLNTPKTPVFDKSRLLYGLAEGREAIHREGRVAVVEGYTDVIMAHQAGLSYFVASLGTAFTEENARQLSRLGARVWMVFDGDTAGQKASERSLEVLVPEELDVRVFTVPGGADPCEAIRASGAEAFQSRMEKESVGLFEFKWRRTVESGPAQTVSSNGEADPAAASPHAMSPVARGRALDDCLRLLSRVPNVITQKLLLREFSERIGVDEKEVTLRFRKLSRPSPLRRRTLADSLPQDHPRHDDGAGEGVPGAGSAVVPPRGVRELEQIILECILALPHDAAEMLKEVPEDLFQDDGSSELIAAIERQLESGGLTPERLVREVQNVEWQRRLIEILDRLRPEDGEAEGPSPDYGEVWRYALRDIRRYLIGREIDALSGQLERAKREGATERCRELYRARIEAKKKLKLMTRPGGGKAGASAG